MNFRIYATLASWVLLFLAVFTGVIAPYPAVILGFAAAAALTPVSLFAGQLAACPTPFEALRIATEGLPDEVHQKSVWRSMWLNVIPRTEFPMNKGVSQTTFVIGNSEPTSNAEAWTEITLTDNTIATMCGPVFNDADVGYNEYTYNPRRFGLKGPVICRETLMFAHNPVQFVKMYVNKLGHRAKRSMEFQLRNAYTAIADKFVTRPGELNVTQGSTTFPQLAASSQLTWDYLDEAALLLMQAGATSSDDDMIEWGPDGPLFLLEIGIQAKQRLFTNGSNATTATAMREDLRHAGERGDRNLLFRRLGATDTHKNYRLVPDLYPSRYTFTPGVGYAEVDTWEMVASTQGTVARLTTAWKAALYEGARIVNPSVMNARFVRPESAGLDWEPTNYTLDWIWKTGGDISETYCFDPLKNYGRHFAQAIYAPEAVFPDQGGTIIFKRCPADITSADCAYA